MKNILTVNAGSSSLKLSVQSNDFHLRKLLSFNASHLLENPKFEVIINNNKEIIDLEYDKENLISSILLSFFDYLTKKHIYIDCVSHRVVHGGRKYIDSVIITDEILADLELLSPLAPLHQPFNLKLIKEIQKLFPNMKQVACFDTMFHMKNRDPINSLIALPLQLREEGVQKYGFHGLSYEYVTNLLGKYINPNKNKTITAHLGSGCSLLASFGNKAVTTSMGFSALDGLPMGTRTGRLDPGVILYLMQNKKMDYKQIENLLYKESGWKGLSNLSGDMKLLLENKDKKEVQDTIQYFVNEVSFYISGLITSLNGIDNIVFTGGIGENNSYIRKLILEKLSWLGIDINHEYNNNIREGLISTENSKVNVYVIPTDEEHTLAEHSLKFL